MVEELLSEDGLSGLGRTRQKEVIADHCAEIENRIRSAGSREEAETIAGVACHQFESECSSDLVRRGLVQRVHQMVEQHWGKEGTK